SPAGLRGTQEGPRKDPALSSADPELGRRRPPPRESLRCEACARCRRPLVALHRQILSRVSGSSAEVTPGRERSRRTLQRAAAWRSRAPGDTSCSPSASRDRGDLAQPTGPQGQEASRRGRGRSAVLSEAELR
ncbi:Hypothetical predicted protein, partial [Marmota monax]